MIIGVVKEARPGETRVAATPATVAQLLKLGYEVVVEPGAGAASSFPDEAYVEAGATIGDAAGGGHRASASTRRRREQLDGLRDGRDAGRHPDARRSNPDLVEDLARRPITALAMDAVPRISRAQSLDVLSLDGEHRRLPRGGRGRARVRPVLHRPGDRRRQGPAGQGAGRRRRRRRAWPRSARRAAWARSCGRPTRGPRSPTRCRSLGGEYLSVEAADVEVSRDRLRQGDVGRLQRPRRRAVRRAGHGRRHHHHHRADPGPPGAAADHRRDGGLDEAGQRDRRHGRRQRRQRRGHGRRARRS